MMIDSIEYRHVAIRLSKKQTCSLGASTAGRWHWREANFTCLLQPRRCQCMMARSDDSVCLDDFLDLECAVHAQCRAVQVPEEIVTTSLNEPTTNDTPSQPPCQRRHNQARLNGAASRQRPASQVDDTHQALTRGLYSYSGCDRSQLKFKDKKDKNDMAVKF
jgi:hypothetical protein